MARLLGQRRTLIARSDGTRALLTPYRVLAHELGPRKIRIKSIHAGMVETEGTHSGGIIGSDLEKALIAQAWPGPTDKIGHIAPIVLFLALHELPVAHGRAAPASGSEPKFQTTIQPAMGDPNPKTRSRETNERRECLRMATANGLVAPGLRDYNMRCRSLAQFKSQHDDNVPLSPIWESAFPCSLCLVYGSASYVCRWPRL
jgi:hypothetical protein